MVVRVVTLGREQANSRVKDLRLNSLNVGNKIVGFAKT